LVVAESLFGYRFQQLSCLVEIGKRGDTGFTRLKIETFAQRDIFLSGEEGDPALVGLTELERGQGILCGKPYI